MSVPET